MAKYTTELRSICEVYAGYTEQQGLSKVDDVIAKSLPKLFDFDFPMYDEAYRSVLETKIVKHFYTREICAETVGRWKLFLNERLNLIMPYYNQRYKSTLIEFNPMYDVDLTTDHSKDNDGNSESNTNSENNSKHNLTSNSTSEENADGWQMFNDTPQGALTGIENNEYLTNASHNKSTNNSSNNSSNTGSENTVNQNHGNSKYTDTESYLEHVKGKTAGSSFSKMLYEYRKTFINIDNEIINDLNDLFINLW